MPEDSMMSDDTGMDDSLYADNISDKEENPAEDKTESIDEENAENPTALIPTSALGGSAKVGDSVTLKVVALHDDEAEVEIASGKKGESKEEGSADDELESMASTNKGY